MKRKRLIGAAWAAWAALVCGASATAQEAAGPSLEGTWLVQITLRDCASGTATAAPFFSLLTFARGGTLVETTSAPGFAPSVRGPAHGIWTDLGGGTYRASMLAMITAGGTLTRGQIIRQQIRLSGTGDTFTSDAVISFVSPAGKLLGSGCSAAAAQRFQ